MKPSPYKASDLLLSILDHKAWYKRLSDPNKPYDKLLNHLISLEWEEDSKLPTAKALAKQMGVSSSKLKVLLEKIYADFKIKAEEEPQFLGKGEHLVELDFWHFEYSVYVTLYMPFIPREGEKIEIPALKPDLDLPFFVHKIKHSITPDGHLTNIILEPIAFDEEREEAFFERMNKRMKLRYTSE